MPFKIVNVKDWDKNGTYIGRGSVFGNPFTHLPLDMTKAKFQVATRDQAVDMYRGYALGQYEENEFFRLCLNALAEDHLRGKEVVLGCYCAPQRCHGEIIAELATALAELGLVSAGGGDDNPF